MTKFQMKWAGLLALVVLGLFLVFPSINWYGLDAKERAQMEAGRMRPKYLLNLGLDLKGGTHLLMELDINRLPPNSDVGDALNRAIEIIRNRVDQLGVAEPLITRQGERWIAVQLPGITDSQHAKELVGKTALLEFHIEEKSDAVTAAYEKIAALGDPFEAGKVKPEAQKLLPPGMALFQGRERSFYILRAEAPVTGSELENARIETGQAGEPIVGFKFKPEGGRVFGALTAANVGKRLAIILDGIVFSAPNIEGPIHGGSGIIQGNFTMEDAKSLAIVLRAGALPAPVNIIEERTVGASLGEDSIHAGLMSCLFGGLVIFGFLAIYYKLSGVMANVSLTLNIFFLFAAMAYLGSTLTLPGLAGIVLTLAMAVDANVLIFERIKEEMTAGKPVRLAMDAGYNKAATAIFDSNITVLVAAAFLFQFGTGPIKGFAVTLMIGNLISMFTATVATNLMQKGWLSAGDGKSLSIWPPFHMKALPKVDWIKQRYLFFAVSGTLMAVSLGSLFTRGFNYSIDFVGGTLVQVTYTQPKTLADLRKNLEQIGFDQAMPQSFSGTNGFAIRIKNSAELDSQGIEAFVDKLQKADPANTLRVDRKEYVGPAVGKHLKKQALFALCLALGGIVAYVAFRFSNPLWGIAGLVALFHDVIATAGLFSLTGKEVDLVIVASFLTIAGYSINDTIVIFDRMRERMGLFRKESLDACINSSINEMMSRTLMTNGCVIAVNLVLFFFGGPVLHDFATAMLFGGVIGTCSTIAIATPLVYQWTRGRGAL